MTSPIEVETDRLVIGSVGVEVDIDRSDGTGDIRGDEKEIAAMRPNGPLFTVEHPTGWIVGNVTPAHGPRVAQRRRIILAWRK